MPWPTVRVGDEDARVSSVTVDSGAAASVAPASAFAEAAQLEPQWAMLLAGNGEVVPELGSLSITDYQRAGLRG